MDERTSSTTLRRRLRVGMALALLLVALSIASFAPSTTTLYRLRDDVSVALTSTLLNTPPKLLVHYTDKRRAPETEGNWTQVNGPRIDIRYYNDDDCLALVKQHRPHFVDTYTTQLSIVERADYFRYLVVWAYGGLYVDSDIKFEQPVDKWLETFGWYEHGKTVNDSSSKSSPANEPNRDASEAHMLLSTLDLVVGVEFPKPQSHYKATGWLPIQISQFLFAGAKGSSVMKRILDHIEVCIATIPKDGEVEKTLERTGPAAFTRAIVAEIETRGLSSTAVRKMVANSSVEVGHPPALLPLPELERNGQLIAIAQEFDPLQQAELSKPNEYILVLPYRAFGYNDAHGLAPGPALAFHRNQNSWRKTADSALRMP